MNTAGLRLIGLKQALLGGGAPDLPPRQRTAEMLHLRYPHSCRRTRQGTGSTVESGGNLAQRLQLVEPHRALTLRQQARENGRVTAHASQLSPSEAARARIQQRIRLAYACVAVSPALTRHLVALVCVEEGHVDADTRRKLEKSFRLVRKDACGTCGVIRIPGLTCQGRIKSLRGSRKARRYGRRYRKEQRGLLGSADSTWEPGTELVKAKKTPVACLVTRCCGCSAVSDVGPSHFNLPTRSKRAPVDGTPDEPQIQRRAVVKKRRGLSLTEKLMSKSGLAQGTDRAEVSKSNLCALAPKKQRTRTSPATFSASAPLNSSTPANSPIDMDVVVSKPEGSRKQANPEMLDAMLGNFIDAL